MQEVKKATKALKGNQNIGPELNEKWICKIVGSKLLEKLTYFFNEIFHHEQIPQSWLGTWTSLADRPHTNCTNSIF